MRGLLAHNWALPGPAALLALTGQGFHGQRDRVWVAAPGNLHLTVAMAPEVHAERVGPGLAILPAVALVDAIEAVTEDRVRVGLKWVNDLLLGDAKVGGVITAVQSIGDLVDTVVMGLAVNAAVAPEVEPTVFVPRVGCPMDDPAAEDLELAPLFWAVLEAVDARLGRLLVHGPGELLRAYRQHSAVLGRRVAIWPEEEVDGAGEPRVRGTVLAIEDDLGLLVHPHPEPVRRGRLAFDADLPEQQQ